MPEDNRGRKKQEDTFVPDSLNHIAVLMGGWSSERPVSLKSGEACANALEKNGYRVTRIDVDRNLPETLMKEQVDACFNALHGKWGEDGCVQGILEVLDIPYTHSGVLASALAMDKARAKVALADTGVPVAASVVVSREEAVRGHPLPPPYVLKPVHEGSSVGIFLVREGEQVPKKLAESGQPEDRILVEEFVPGREFTCAVMHDTPLAVTEIKPAAGYDFYDFDAKYAPGGSVHILPAKIPEELTKTIKKYAVMAHEALGCRGISRTDFLYDDSKGPEKGLVCLEVNTQPGMTETSLVPEQAAHVGMTFEQLVRWMVEDASCNR